MRETLSEVPAATVPPERDRAEQHLRPAEDRIELPDDAVRADSPRAEGALVYVELEVDPERELEGEGGEEDVGHLAVRPGEEGASAVRVPEDVAPDGEGEA